MQVPVKQEESRIIKITLEVVCQELALDPDQRVVSQPPCMTVGISQFDPAQQCVPMQERLTFIFKISLQYCYSYV